jgi:hypothetical protein
MEYVQDFVKLVYLIVNKCRIRFFLQSRILDVASYFSHHFILVEVMPLSVCVTDIKRPIEHLFYCYDYY